MGGDRVNDLQPIYDFLRSYGDPCPEATVVLVGPAYAVFDVVAGEVDRLEAELTALRTRANELVAYLGEPA